MARRSTTPPSPPPPAILTAQDMALGIDRLRKRLEDVEKFEPTSVTEQFNIPHVEALSASVEEALARTFGAHTLDSARQRSAIQSTLAVPLLSVAHIVPASKLSVACSNTRRR